VEVKVFSADQVTASLNTDDNSASRIDSTPDAATTNSSPTPRRIR